LRKQHTKTPLKDLFILFTDFLFAHHRFSKTVKIIPYFFLLVNRLNKIRANFFLNFFTPDSRFYPAEFCCFADAPRFAAEAVGGGTTPPVRAKRRRPFGGKCAQTSRT
jgi:hypothetical protein